MGLVPFEGRLWSEYQTVRQDIALAEHELLNITTAGQNISQFAVHHKLPFLQELYSKGQAAFVSNIGALVEPITKEQYKAGQGEKCVGLFFSFRSTSRSSYAEVPSGGNFPKGSRRSHQRCFESPKLSDPFFLNRWDGNMVARLPD